MDKMREAFEAWAYKTWLGPTDVRSDGSYDEREVEEFWKAWQAAWSAALAAKPLEGS